MGQGGFITLVNATSYDWTLSHKHSYQMNSWDFPDTISAHSEKTLYIEWDQGIFTTVSDDAGEARYTIDDANQSSFEVQASVLKNGDFNLQVNFDDLTTNGNPQGSTLDLGWEHNGIVNFILAGEQGNYTGSNLRAQSWMKDNLALLGDKKLADICITGSHDSGMSVFTSGTAFASKDNTLTQTHSINGQLNLGARYFDIRPVISAGDFYTGHYSHIGDKTWQGANGQSIADIITDVNSFTAENDELIILNLSHSLNTDLGNNSYRSFTQEEWSKLFNQLNELNHLYVCAANTDLITQTLNDFVKNGPAVLIILEANGISLGNFAGKGFFTYSEFNAYNSYADSSDLDTMAKNQLKKMNEQKAKGAYFLLSWTLTQGTQQVLLGPSIKNLATHANQNLAKKLYPAVTAQSFPNIIYTDNIKTSIAAAMAMAVNWTLEN